MTVFIFAETTENLQNSARLIAETESYGAVGKLE